MMAKKGKMKHIHIEPNTDGTAHIKVHRAPPAMQSNQPMPYDYDSNDESMSGSPEEAGANVTKILKQHFGKSDNDADDKPQPMRKAFGRPGKY
jgi:hypothetical protein